MIKISSPPTVKYAIGNVAVLVMCVVCLLVVATAVATIFLAITLVVAV